MQMRSGQSEVISADGTAAARGGGGLAERARRDSGPPQIDRAHTAKLIADSQTPRYNTHDTPS